MKKLFITITLAIFTLVVFMACAAPAMITPLTITFPKFLRCQKGGSCKGCTANGDCYALPKQWDFTTRVMVDGTFKYVRTNGIRVNYFNTIEVNYKQPKFNGEWLNLIVENGASSSDTLKYNKNFKPNLAPEGGVWCQASVEECTVYK